MTHLHALQLRTVGHPKAFWSDGASFYETRLRPYADLEWISVKQERYGGALQKAVEKEGDGLLRGLQPAHALIALDVGGKSHSTEDFASLLDGLWSAGKTPAFAIGGPFGLDRQVLEKAHLPLSLSPMTLLHDAAAVLLLEQIYRAIKILRAEPYHH